MYILCIKPGQRTMNLRDPPYQMKLLALPLIPSQVPSKTFSFPSSDYSSSHTPRWYLSFNIIWVFWFSSNITWKATITYGVLSSTFCIISAMLNWSGILSRISSTIALTFSSLKIKFHFYLESMKYDNTNLVVTIPPPPPASLGWSSNTVLKSFSEVAVRKPISALGWRPYK